MSIIDEPDEADIVKRPGVFLYGRYTVDVDRDDDGNLSIQIPEHLERLYKIRQQQQRIDECHFRWRSERDSIEIRESILDQPDFRYAWYERIRFPDGKIPLNFERVIKEFDKVLVDSCKDHVMIYAIKKKEAKGDKK